MTAEIKKKMLDADCDALYCPAASGECTCLIGDLAPCGDGWGSCLMGHAIPDDLKLPVSGRYKVIPRGMLRIDLLQALALVRAMREKLRLLAVKQEG